MQHTELNRPHWHRGQLLAFSGLDGATDYADGLTARTIEEPAGIEIKQPEDCRIYFPCAVSGKVLFSGDCFRFEGPEGEVRGVLVDAYHLLINTTCRVDGAQEKLRMEINGNRMLIGARSHFDGALIESDFDAVWAARNQWLDGQDIQRGSPETTRTLHRALSLMKTQVCSSEGILQRRWTTPDRWPHKDMWLWDSAFHAIGWRHIDPALAMEMLDAVLDGQRGDGFIPLRASPLKIEPVMTQPPILCQGVKKVVEITNDWDWVAHIFPKLCAYVEWDFANRDSDGMGLVEWLSLIHI